MGRGIPHDSSAKGPQPERLPGTINRVIVPAFRRAIGDGSQDAGVIGGLAHCWGNLNRLHPFREGNGRATQIFIAALAHRQGRDINWRTVSYDAEIMAAKTSMTGDMRGYEAIIAIALKSDGPPSQPGPFWPARPWNTDEPETE